MKKSKQVNLAALDGEDLWNAIKSKNFTVKKEPPKPRIVDKLAPSSAQTWAWTDTKLVMIINRQMCDCGKIYEHPNEHIFLRREGKGGAIHYTALDANIPDPESRFMELETAFEYRESECRACQFCFNLAHVIERARQPEKPLPQPPASPAVEQVLPPLPPSFSQAPASIVPPVDFAEPSTPLSDIFDGDKS